MRSLLVCLARVVCSVAYWVVVRGLCRLYVCKECVGGLLVCLRSVTGREVFLVTMVSYWEVLWIIVPGIPLIVVNRVGDAGSPPVTLITIRLCMIWRYVMLCLWVKVL